MKSNKKKGKHYEKFEQILIFCKNIASKLFTNQIYKIIFILYQMSYKVYIIFGFFYINYKFYINFILFFLYR